jgi:hypothetical protein
MNRCITVRQVGMPLVSTAYYVSEHCLHVTLQASRRGAFMWNGRVHSNIPLLLRYSDVGRADRLCQQSYISATAVASRPGLERLK